MLHQKKEDILECQGGIFDFSVFKYLNLDTFVLMPDKEVNYVY